MTRPINVSGLPGPVRLISAGFFHNVVIDEEENVYTWGCNPQVLRLEAQQKKRERLQTIRKEMERQNQQQEVRESFICCVCQMKSHRLLSLQIIICIPH